MLTRSHIDRLHKIFAHGIWNSPAEFIFSAFTKSSNVQSPPPHKFTHLSIPEYDMVVAYGLSEIAIAKGLPTIITDGAEHPNKSIKTGSFENFSGSTITGYDKPVEVQPQNKKRHSVKKNYVSIWDKPLSDIESSLIFEDEDEDDHILPSKKQSINRTFFNFATGKDDSAMFVHPLTVEKSVEKSEKMLKVMLDNYGGTLVQFDHETELSQPEIQKKTSETLAKFKTK